MRSTILIALFLSTAALAQKPTPDVLVFSNGDQLTGHLERAAGGSVTFKSDMAGELTLSFDKIKELRSGTGAAEFAIIRKGQTVKRHATAPESSVSIADARLTINSTSEAVPAASVAYLIPKAEFEKQVTGDHSFFADWNGSVTGGATIVRSTTTATTLSAALSLTRVEPTVPWLAPSNRTTLNVAESYGKNTSPGAIPQTTPATPSVTTLSNIFHADSERDQYLSPRFFALGDVAFDHNYAQGLQLQQVYGGGGGWTAIKSAHQQMDLKADIHYEMQTYIAPTTGSAAPSTHLVGSTLFEGYHRDLPRKAVFTESFNFLPSFNVSSDYSYALNAGLAIPVFKRLSASVTATDNYLNDPAPGYNKNSFQFILGANYTFR